jgi:hypothetical protein
MIRRLPVFLVILYLPGCAGLETEWWQVQPGPRFDDQAREEGAKNLVAIAKLRSATSEARPVVEPNDLNGPPPAPQAANREAILDLLFLAHPPSLPRSHTAPSPAASLPRMQPTRPSKGLDYDPHALSQPRVPPYTLFAPLGSAYPGSIRCVPDYLGGQRCHAGP